MKKNYMICITCIFFTLLCSCKDKTEPLNTVQAPPKKVFSLSASMSEIWLLAGGELSGVTSDAVSERDLGLPNDILIIGTVKDPNLEIIISEAPDFVILAEDISSHLEIAETLEKVGIPYYKAKVETLDDYISTLLDFTEITGFEDEYYKNGTLVKEEVEDLLTKIPASSKNEEKTALFLRAYSTGVKAKAEDHTVCYILKDIGVKNIAESSSTMLEDLSMEIIIEADPDFIFIVTMGDNEKAIESLKQTLISNPAWNDLKAVKNDTMILLEKDLYHYKPNSRWREAYETILKIVYPETFSKQ